MDGFGFAPWHRAAWYAAIDRQVRVGHGLRENGFRLIVRRLNVVAWFEGRADVRTKVNPAGAVPYDSRPRVDERVDPEVPQFVAARCDEHDVSRGSRRRERAHQLEPARDAAAAFAGAG